MILASSGGLSAGSSPISLISEMGSGPVVGEEPVHSTSIFEATVTDSLSFLESNLTFQLLDYEEYQLTVNGGEDWVKTNL